MQKNLKEPLCKLAPFLSTSKGLFITLKQGGVVLECIGNPFPTATLQETYDELCTQLTHTNFDEVKFSILSTPVITQPEEIQIGRHGVIIIKGAKHALYLPEVALENSWSLNTLMKNLCAKADLDKDAWEEGATLYAFETTVVLFQGVKSSDWYQS